MNLEEIIKGIKHGVADFKNAPVLSFKDILKPNLSPQANKLRFAGVYAIYEKNKGLIYIGEAGGKRLGYRIADLFYYNSKNRKFKHTLTKRLLMQIKRSKTMQSLSQFYFKRCLIKTVKTKTVEDAKILEAVLITLFKPKYNVFRF